MEQQIDLPFDLALPASKILRAGALTCMYETGNIRYISLGNTELVRKIYGAVRFEDWATIPYKIQDEKLVINDSDFSISYTAVFERDGNIYEANFYIEGKADNSISFSMKGTALADFKRNRIGLCIHHPVKECSGRNAIITRPDGTTYQSLFPDLVNPELPFLEMNQLQWVTADNLNVQLTFEGDVFETEDQRNWSDSSFKTYSTRSDLPRPVLVKTGDTIDQKVTVKISGVENKNGNETNNELREVSVPFPQIGYCRSSNGPAISDEVAQWLVKIPFDHYRVSITLNQIDWADQLNQALKEALLIDASLELVVFLTSDFENEALQLIGRLKEQQLLVQSVLVLQQDHNVSPPELLRSLYAVLKEALPAVKIGYGTDAIFVDVNQNRPVDTPFDFISFGIQPQAHAFDNRSILENLQRQPDILKTAINISGGQPVSISPVTLKDRNSGADERQYSSLAALWTLITLQNFSEAYSITFYELFGAAGILPTGFQNNQQLTPVYDALMAIYNFKPTFIIKRYNDDELLMDGLLLENDKGDRLFFKAPDQYLSAMRCELCAKPPNG